MSDEPCSGLSESDADKFSIYSYYNELKHNDKAPTDHNIRNWQTDHKNIDLISYKVTKESIYFVRLK